MHDLSNPTSAPARPQWARLAVLATAWLCVAVFGAAAGTLPAPRPPRAPLTPLAPARAPSALDAACGAAVDALPEAYAAFAEHTATTLGPLPTPNSTDAGEIAVLEDDGTFFFTDKNGNVNLDVAAATRAFYRTHGDDYDEVALWLTSGLSNWLGSPTALAAAWIMRNDVTGIGLQLFDYNAALGLPRRLRTVLTMNGLDRYPDDPGTEVTGLPRYVTQDVLAHEFAHTWLAYPWVLNPAGDNAVLLGRAFQHWSFFLDADGSVMEGADWQEAAPDSFVGLTPIARFGVLDQYLMGVRAPAEVDSFFVISDTAAFTPPGPYVAISDPQAGMTARGPALRFAVGDVEAANGPRLPDAAGSPHHQRMAFVLIVPRGAKPGAADLAKLEGIRAAFPLTMSAYTGGRMTLDATIDSHAGRIRLAHEPLPQTESPLVPRTVAVRATVDPGGIPIAVRPDGVSLWWRTDPGQLWNPVPMTAAAPDTFVAALPGVPAGTAIQYWFRAESDSAGLRTDLPELSRSAPFIAFTGPDTTAPAVEHWPVYEQSNERLPQALLARVRDAVGVDSVWCEYAVDEGVPQSVAAARVGRDSFQVALGAGLPRGARLAYRFAARDRSLARNVGYSSPAFDTLHVGQDLVDEFWNPSGWFHGNVRYNRRDEWHLVENPSVPAGSTAWHCGLDSLPYGPYQDAALTSPPVYDITPGCTLTFVHRWSLEDGPGLLAYDGARVEVVGPGGVWEAATPFNGYTHTMAQYDQGLPQNAECWSGVQDTWRYERVDLSPWAPGPIRVRFRMSSDLFVGRGGWWVDQVRFHFPGAPTLGVEGGSPRGVEAGAPWPNPSTGSLRQSLRLPRAATLDWSLYDLAGRRVLTLWRGTLAPGAHELSAAIPHDLAAGLYFSRLGVDGRALAARRVALLR